MDSSSYGTIKDAVDIVPRGCVCLWILFQGCVRVCLCVCICASVLAHVCRHGGQRSTSDVFLFVPDLLTLFSETASCIARGAHSLGDCPANEAPPPTYLPPLSTGWQMHTLALGFLYVGAACLNSGSHAVRSSALSTEASPHPPPRFSLFVCLF